MSGSHWVATDVKDRVINYFDSFGMPPFREIVHHAKEQNLTLLHQNRQMQNLYTSTCGYFCLYFLNEMHKGKSYFDLLGVFDFDTDNNEKFIEKYFKNKILNIKYRMENFKERLRSFLDTELNNLINERCRETNTVLDHRTELQERLTDDIVRDVYHRCNNEITKQLLKEIVKKNFKEEDIVNKITFRGTSLNFY